MAVYDMDDALKTARTRHPSHSHSHSHSHSNSNTSHAHHNDYTHPIASAQQSGLPFIDISPYLSATPDPAALQDTARAINAACVNYGFFYLVGHGIALADLDRVIALARRFFALPLAAKNKIKRHDAGGSEGGDSARGYQGLGENVTGGLQDMQEAVDFYASWPVDKVEEGDGGPGSRKTLQGPNLWPEEPAELREMYEAYVERVEEVGRAVVRAMGVAIGLDDHLHHEEDTEDDEEDEQDPQNTFLRHCHPSFWVLRMINYPPLPSPSPSTTTSPTPTQLSCGAHTDYGCVTLLLTDPTPGALHVQLKNGDWLPADPVRGAFVVNIGDMMERWTNGIWKSTLHRVIHTGHISTIGTATTEPDAIEHGRISVPFFFEPGFDALVKPLRKCVRRSGRPEIRDRGTYGEHLLTKVFSNFYYSKRTDW